MKDGAGFSLVEVLLIFLITSILILASYPVLSRKKINEAKNTNVVQCIEIEGAANLATPACSASLNGGLFNMVNYFDTLMSYVDGSDLTQSTNALKILKAVCDQGGNLACDKIIGRCASDINKCEQTYDLKYYLTLLSTDSNTSKSYLTSILARYYSVNMTNVKTEVDKWCCSNGVNLACDVNGIDFCPKRFGGTLLDQNYAMALDGSGNIFLTGDQRSDTYGSDDTFVIKLDSKGTILWKKKIGMSDIDYGYGIATDGSGNSYVTGYSFVSGASYEIFVIKLDPSGNILWQKRIGGASYDQAYAIAVDNSGNSYITGYEASDIYTFAEIFVIKLDTAGTIVWKKKIGGTGIDQALGIAIDTSGNSYITGVQSSDTYGGDDIFVIKLDSTGTIAWQKKIGGTGTDRGTAIAIDASGNSYITGYEASDTYGGDDIFVIKLGSTGTIAWQKKIGGAGTDRGLGITADTSGNSYITGWQTSISSGGSDDIFVMKLDTSGSIKWQKNIGGTGIDDGRGIALDSSGNIFITGFESSDSYGNYDVFIIKLANNQTSNLSLNNTSISLSNASSALSSSDVNLTIQNSTYGISDLNFSSVTLDRAKILGLP